MLVRVFLAIGRYLRQHHVALLALMFALGGTAYAASLPRKSVGTKQLKTGAVTAKKIAGGAVGSDAVLDNSLSGADLDESTLQGVNAASLNGQTPADLASIGRSTPATEICGDEQHVSGGQLCASTEITLPVRSRVLVAISATTQVIALDDASGPGSGTDETSFALGSCAALIDDTRIVASATSGFHVASIGSLSGMKAAGPFDAGTHQLSIRCSEGDGTIAFLNPAASAVTLSAD